MAMFLLGLGEYIDGMCGKKPSEDFSSASKVGSQEVSKLKKANLCIWDACMVYNI